MDNEMKKQKLTWQDLKEWNVEQLHQDEDEVQPKKT